MTHVKLRELAHVGRRRARRTLARAVVLFLTVCLAALGGGTVTASATEPSQGADSTVGPVITSPSSGEIVHGAITVTVTSSAPTVLITWADYVDTELERAWPTTDGIATAVLSTSGYSGPTTIIARDCPGAGVCDGQQTSIEVDATNARPVLADMPWLKDIYGDALVVLAEDEGDWAWYALMIDGDFAPPVVPGRQLMFDATALGDGLHTLQVVRCVELAHFRFWQVDPWGCDFTHPSEPRPFTVRTALHPDFAVSPRVITPDGDGHGDAATVTMNVETSQVVGWRLTNGAQVVAGGDITDPPVGPNSFRVTGLDRDGHPLADGSYTLRLFTLVPDRNLFAQQEFPLEIDLKAPRVAHATASPQTFYPRVDGYRDRVRISGVLSEPAAHLRVELVRENQVRRTLRLGPHDLGTFSTTWDGLRRSGKRAAAGKYRYRFVVTDRHGNQDTRPGGSFTLHAGR